MSGSFTPFFLFAFLSFTHSSNDFKSSLLDPIYSVNNKGLIDKQFTPSKSLGFQPKKRQILVPDLNSNEVFTPQCFTKTCDQLITGRNLSYNRALEIIQDEEYLDAADYDDIRRHAKPYSRHPWRWKRQSPNQNEDIPPDQTTTTTTQSTTVSTPLPIETLINDPNVQRGAAVASLGAAIGAAFIFSPPIPPVVPAGTIPPGNPLPGTPGGGVDPTVVTPDSTIASSLVPAGLTPVATFPPFATPRTFPAAAVIFSETPAVTRRRQRRWILDHFKRLSRRIGIQSTQGRYMKTMRLKWSCLRARVARSLGLLDPEMKAAPKFTQPKNGLNPPRMTLSQCFDDMKEPKFGFRVLVTLVDQEPCDIDVNCFTFNENFALNRRFLSRQTGEQFSSDAPPSCRVQNVPC